MRPLWIGLAFMSIFAALPSSVRSATPESGKLATGEIVESGICEPGPVSETYSQPQSTAGYAGITSSLMIAKTTEDIPLRKGVGFGFKWKARNLPQDADITYLVEHPPITRPDGKTLSRFEETMKQETKLGVLETVDCYFLAEDHEVVPGTWTLSILHKGITLVKRSFRVK